MIQVDGTSLTLEQLAAIADDRAAVALAPAAVDRIDAARRVVERFAGGDGAVYGINTGFGALAETRIPRSELQALQLNLLRSHAAGVGEPLATAVVRATLALRANVLAKGYSGVRRATVERLLDPALSELPAFLTPDGGLQSGYMLVQVTAAALASELKRLAHPAGVDTIPTSANREDHVSMSMGAALKADRAVRLATLVVAAELLCAAQAIDLLAPVATSPRLQRVHAAIRSAVPRLDRDRPPSPDVDAIARLIAEAVVERACGGEVK